MWRPFDMKLYFKWSRVQLNSTIHWQASGDLTVCLSVFFDPLSRIACGQPWSRQVQCSCHLYGCSLYWNHLIFFSSQNGFAALNKKPLIGSKIQTGSSVIFHPFVRTYLLVNSIGQISKKERERSRFVKPNNSLPLSLIRFTGFVGCPWCSRTCS